MAASPRVVLTAETGSGKTTQVPQILCHSPAVRGQILVLEPRRLAARMTAARVASERGVRLGAEVGYQTRFDGAWSRETRIGFVTEGVFLRRLREEPGLPGVGAVLLDEFHERSILADLSLGLVRRIQSGARPDLRLLVMSATLDAERLATELQAPALRAEGRTFPVEVVHRPAEPGRAAWEQAADALDEALAAGSDGDALVFMPGAWEIERTVQEISSRRRSGEALAVLPLHGGMPPEAQDQALRPRRERRVIVATNVAQTSITIEGVRLVIDSGTARVHRRAPARDLDALVLEPISQAAADQRAGRAGRTAPGHCIRLWSRQEHARRAVHDAPEVERVDLSDAMLTLAVLAAREGPGVAAAAFESFPWVDAPPTAAVARARECLQALGAIDAAGQPTATGAAMARLPLPPRLARAMVEAGRRGCTGRAAIWCALAAEREVLEERPSPALLARLRGDDEPGDLVVRERLLESPGRDGDGGAVAEVRRAATQVARAASAVGGRAPRRDDSLKAVTISLAAGFPEHVAWRPDGARPHAFLAGRRKVSIHPQSLARGSGFVLALEIRADARDPSTQVLSLLSPLRQEWVEEAFPERFETRVEQRWNPERRAVEEAEERCFDGIPIQATLRPPRRLAAAGQLLAERISAGEVALSQWDERVEQWLARVRCARAWFPEEGLLAYDEQDLAVIRAEIVGERFRASQVEDLPCLDAVRAALGDAGCRLVERVAPAELPLPNGRRLRLRYEPGQPPRGAARIQDLYGLDSSPTVARGRVPVLLEILGPNQRPLQVTSDLAGFWSRLYPQLKPELKRRYPRHEWR